MRGAAAAKSALREVSSEVKYHLEAIDEIAALAEKSAMHA
jgi:hypothetical protein